MTTSVDQLRRQRVERLQNGQAQAEALGDAASPEDPIPDDGEVVSTADDEEDAEEAAA